MVTRIAREDQQIGVISGTAKERRTAYEVDFLTLNYEVRMNTVRQEDDLTITVIALTVKSTQTCRMYQ